MRAFPTPIVLALVLLAPMAIADPLTNVPLWVSVSPTNAGQASDVAVSPDGQVVYAAGSGILPFGYLAGRQSDGLVRALNALTGATLWESTFDNGGFYDSFRAVGVSADGATVYAAGLGGNWLGGGAVTLVAYRAVDGAKLWSTLASVQFEPNAINVAGGRVFVSGPVANQQATVVAFDGTTGGELWSFAGSWGDYQLSPVAVKANGSRVFVGGSSDWGGMTVFALDGATGATLWTQFFGGNQYSQIAALVLPPGEANLLVVWNDETNDGYDIAFASLDAGNGGYVWDSSFTSPGWERTYSATATSNGDLVIGGQRDGWAPLGFLVLRVDGATGVVKWATDVPSATYAVPIVRDTVVAGDRVVVTGLLTPEYPRDELKQLGQASATTVAFDAATGAVAWRSDLDVPDSWDQGVALAAAPDASRVFVAVDDALPGVVSYAVL